MEQVKWYKRLLCGYNILGDVADLLCKGTETKYDLTLTDIRNRTVETRCWCCTFWRGVVTGAAATVIIAGVVYAALRF